ncbi:MAG: branched-chain amino acid ABC transporter permease [Deltaproteobacteria bacterium]|jgi:branched-chain amino acid transport system permease protein|nr:branched-chain amino acid ABC transporter permease [Deltaproteobacteria bacterium]
MFDLSWEIVAMQMIFGLALGCVYVLMAGGLSIIFGLLDVVNFAHGTFYMLGAYAIFVAVSLCGNFWLGLVSAVVIVALVGGVIEWLLLKPLYKRDPLYPLLLTFGVSICIPDIIKICFGLIGKVVPYPSGFMGAFMLGPVMVPKYRLFIIVLTLVVLISLWLFLNKSNLGMIIRASTRDSLMTQTLGINVSRIWTIGFMIGIGLAALAGAVAAPMVASIPDMGVEMTIECFVVVVIGGLGSLGGAIIGGLLIGQVVSFVALFAPAWSNVAIFMAMAIILIIRPRGLFGEEGRL